MSTIINIPPIAAEITGGTVDVNATIGEDRSSVNTRVHGFEFDILPSEKRKLIEYTVPAGKSFIMHLSFGTSDCDMLAELTIDGDIFNSKRNSHMNPDVELWNHAPFLVTEGKIVRIDVTNRSDFSTNSSAEFWVFGHLFTPTPT